MDLAGGRADLALERFEAIRKRNPKSTPAVIAVAEIKMMTESSRAEARKIVEDALASDSGSVRLRLALSGMLVASQDFRQATSVLQTGLATEPENIDLLQALAQVQRRSGDGNQALNTQRRVVSLRPGDPVHVLHLAELQITRGDKVGAENSLTKAIELKGDFLPAQILLSRLLVERNKVDAGRTIVKKIQSQRPNEGIGYALEAELALREKAPAKAMAAYRVSLDKTKSPEIAIRLHRLLSEAKRQAEADELERKWLEDRPEDAVFLNYSAELALKRGDQKASLDRFKALLKIDPNNAPVLNNTAWLLEQMNLPGSLELIDRALKLSPRQPAFLDTKASILAGAGNWSDALKIQREAVTLSPNEVRYRLRLAAYLLRNDKKEEARGELEALEGDRSVAAQVAELKRALNPR
jgi:putative PEP-CTERM system TPR-repeat lipoprotein